MGKKEVVVYGLIDPVTDQLRYVGKTNDLAGRLRAHAKVTRLRSHRTRWIQSLAQKGYTFLVEILETCDNDQDAFIAEREWISMARSWGCSLTNHADGGEGGYSGVRMPAEIKAKISHTLKGHTHSAETKAKIGAANAKAHLGKPKSKRHAENISKGRKGIRLTEEHKRNISIAKRKQVCDGA